MRKQACGIERWQRGIRVVHDQRDLGAAEYNRIAASILHPPDDTLKVGDSLGHENAVDQLTHDDAIDVFAFGGVWAHIRQTSRYESFRIDLTLDEPASPGQANAAKPALDGLCRDNVSDMQPRQRRLLFNVWKRLVDGVVGADQKGCAAFRELVCGREHQLAYSLPVTTIKALHVLGKRVRVHGELGMSVWAQKRRAFRTDCAIAQRCAFGRAGDNSDVLRYDRAEVAHLTAQYCETGFCLTTMAFVARTLASKSTAKPHAPWVSQYSAGKYGTIKLQKSQHVG